MRILVLTAALLAAFAARADDTISTDRPGYGESSDVVGPGRVQVETSVQSERDSASGTKTRLRTTPTLLRIGLSESAEFRVDSDGRTWARTEDAHGTTRATGWSDASFGVKWRLQKGDEDDGGRPGLALLLDVDADTGSSAFRGQGLRPSLRGVAEWNLPHEFSVGVMPGVLLDRNDEGRRFASGILAVTVSKVWTPAWRGFVEIAGQQLAARRNGGSVVTFDTGVAWVVAPWCQLDLSLERGLTSEAPDWVWAVGASVRF